MKSLILSILFVFCFLSLKAQYPEWVNGYGAKLTADGPAGIVGQKDGSVTSLLHVHGTANDTIHVGQNRIAHSPYQSNLLINTDSTGAVNLVKKIGNGFYMILAGDGNGNYYVSGELTISNANLAGIPISRSAGRLVFAKLDKNFNLLWYTQTGDSMQVYSNNLVFTAGRLYFVCTQMQTGYIGSKYYDAGYDMDYILGELDPLTGDIWWSKRLFQSINEYSSGRVNDILVLNNRIYIACRSQVLRNLVMKGDTAMRNSGIIMQLDMAGNYQKMIALTTSGSKWGTYSGALITSMTTDGKNIFITGGFKDTMYWFGQTYPSDFYGYGIPIPLHHLFMASVTPTLKSRWFYKPDGDEKGFAPCIGFEAMVKNGSVYFLGNTESTLQFDSFLVSTPELMARQILVKMDFDGSIQSVVPYAISSAIANWGYNGWSSALGAIMPNHDFIYASSSFKWDLESGQHKISALGNIDAYLVKIADNTITRGPVLPGPYCAGDTISIPYTKKGDFDSLNYFIAELSDANGSFDKTVHRLGVLRTNKDSTINGVLPLFEVQSSAAYRIRIRSTRPAVTSFYKLDTLKLLVYSRDKADAGKDTAICYGDSLELKTFGGTKWQWSPNIRMADSTKNSTKVWPITNTTYRIVIADSSGCGIADTAYKTVLVRRAKAELNVTDTSICKGDTLQLVTTFSGGDSNNYHWIWQQDNNGNWLPLQSGSHKMQDAFVFAYEQDTAIKLRLLLSDGCPKVWDTTNVNIGPKSPLKVFATPADTLLCAGVAYRSKASAFGGNKNNYQFQWQSFGNGTVLSNSDSLNWIPTQNSRLLLRLSDGCMEKEDSLFVDVAIRRPLSALWNVQDTAICYGNKLQMHAFGFGGDSSNHAFRWILGNQFLDTAKHIEINTKMHFADSGETKLLQLILTDGCSEKGDTQMATISVLGKLKIQTTPQTDTLCFGQRWPIKMIAKGGTGKYSYMWRSSAGQVLSSSDSLLVLHNQKSKTGKQFYKAILSDGCSADDTTIWNVEQLPHLILQIKTTDSCLKTSTELQSNLQGGKAQNYQVKWFANAIEIGTGKTIIIPLPNAEILYSAVLTDGCSHPSDTAFQRLSPYPKITAVATPDSGCEKLTVVYKAMALNGTKNQYKYVVGNSISAWQNDSVFVRNLSAGNYPSNIAVRSSMGCADTFNLGTVRVFPKPKAQFYSTPLRPSPKHPDVRFTNLSKGATQYWWQFEHGSSSEFQPISKFNKIGITPVLLVAITDKGCRDSFTDSVRVYPDYHGDIPTAFTPGGDGLNDVFVPILTGAESYTLSIYNRWGQLLFRGENTGWDGKYLGNPVADGMYVYRLRVVTLRYDKVEEEGTLMLLHPR